MVSDYMRKDMDLFVDPITEGHKLVNVEAADDRYYVPMLQNWIRQNVTRSQVSVIYSMNTFATKALPFRKAKNTDTFRRWKRWMAFRENCLAV
jgi:hypothetical protein